MKGFVFVALIALAVLSGCVQQQPNTGTGSNGEAPLREFSITAQRFSFSPNQIAVDFNDRVKLSITSTDVTHGFSLPEFQINKTLQPGQTVVVEFVANKRGTFTFACSVVCGSGHATMQGTLIVQ